MREEAQKLYDADPNQTPAPHIAILQAEPSWDPNTNAGVFMLNHYGKCVLAGLKRGFPKQKSLNKVQEVQQEISENPSIFLQCIDWAYRKYMDMDPEASENMKMIHMTFTSQSSPDNRKKVKLSKRGDCHESRAIS